MLTGAMLAGCTAAPKNESDQVILKLAQMEACSVQIDFSNSDAVSRWQIVNDGVMGGLSQGTRYHEDDHMVFRGVINTNGGGFSSLRRGMRPGDLAGANGVRLRVRPDGRAYTMTFRTSVRWRGRSVSYQSDIPATPVGEWSDVIVTFDDMRTSIFGRRVRAPEFDPSDVREMGIILADGIDGDFRLEVESLSCMDQTDQPV